MPYSDFHVNGPVTGSNPVDPTAGDSLQNAGYVWATVSKDQTSNPDGLGAGVYASYEMFNPNARGVRLYTTVANGSGTVAFKVQVRNPFNDVWVDLPGAAIAAYNNSAKMITIYPGLTGIADVSDVTCNQHLGPAWRVVATVATATETFSVGADYLL